MLVEISPRDLADPLGDSRCIGRFCELLCFEKLVVVWVENVPEEMWTLSWDTESFSMKSLVSFDVLGDI